MSSYWGFKSLIRTAAQFSVPTARLAGWLRVRLQPPSLTCAHALPSHLSTHAELISAAGAQPGNCIAPSKWKKGRREREKVRKWKIRERRREGGNISKLWHFKKKTNKKNIFAVLQRRLMWQWPVIADGVGRTPVIRVFFNALWTRVGKFYLFLILPFHALTKLVIFRVFHCEWLHVCLSAGMQWRWSRHKVKVVSAVR